MAKSQICPECGELNGAQATQCAVCGAVLSDGEDLPEVNPGPARVQITASDDELEDLFGKLKEVHGDEEDAHKPIDLLYNEEPEEEPEEPSGRGTVLAILIGLLLLGGIIAYLFINQQYAAPHRL
jgi:hypothetical protein